VKGSGRLAMHWAGAGGILREDAVERNASEWMAIKAIHLMPPFGATSLQLRLAGDAQWDAVEVRAQVRQRKVAQVLVNQAGYEPAAPKHFVVQANFPAKAAHFAVVDTSNGQRLFEGELAGRGRIQGHF